MTALGVRRVFFEPSLINFFYYEFFKLNEFVYWSNSNLTFGLFDYPYSLDPAHQIGFYFYGTELQGAITGWLGSGYMNAGYLGVYLYAFLLGLIFSFIDSYKNLIDSKYLVAFTISPLFVLTVQLLSSPPTIIPFMILFSPMNLATNELFGRS